MKNLTSKVNKLVSLLESKDHLIKRLDLTDEQKTKLIDLFKRYPNLEAKIDWNNKDLQWEDFTEVLENAGKSKSQAKKNGLAGLKEGIDYEIVLKRPGLVIYHILTHLASKTIASPQVDPPIEGKWCIAMNDPQWWNNYTQNGNEFFFICYLDDWTLDTYDEDLDRYPDKFAVCRTSVNPAYKNDFTQNEHMQVWNSDDQLIDTWTNTSVKGDKFAEEAFGAISGTKFHAEWIKDSLGVFYRKTADQMLLPEFKNNTSYVRNINAKLKAMPGIPTFTIKKECTEIAKHTIIALDEAKLLNFEPGSVLRKLPDDFAGFSKLEFADFTNAVNIKYLPIDCFNNCLELKRVKLGPNTIGLWEDAFCACRNLRVVQGISKLKMIAANAFYHTDLVNVTLGPDLELLDFGAFSACFNLKTVDLSKCTKLDEIAKKTFYSCSKLELVKLPGSIETINKWAFTRGIRLPENDIPLTIEWPNESDDFQWRFLRYIDWAEDIGLTSKDIIRCSDGDFQIQIKPDSYTLVPRGENK